jgi:hypothetical protein
MRVDDGKRRIHSMRKMMKQRTTEKGQSLVIVVLAIIGLLAALALVLDGGMTFAHRRTAQAAADAGAMAGAAVLCRTGDANEAVAVALDYATVKNPATSANVVADASTRTVEVTTYIPFNTFFAQIIGRPAINVQAEAMVGCVNPGAGDGVLPVAWSCRWGPNQPHNPGDPCTEQAVTWDDSETGPYDPDSIQHRLTTSPTCTYQGTCIWPELYIVMDDVALMDSSICIESGGVVLCDLDGDGEWDFQSSGDRSWLDLDGGGQGSSQLVDWILNGLNRNMTTHEWLPTKSGVSTNIFQAVETRRQTNPIVVVPMYDLICPGNPTLNANCTVHPEDILTYIKGSSSSPTHYHISGFAAFYITCVSTAQNEYCPGKARGVEVGVVPANTQGMSNAKTIEGYFLRGYVPGLGGEGDVDTGAYNLLFRR